ncbi:hypothetical protein H0N98_04295 [Candidatus Micrarchaeota archaeon]|nr:hypothetical protein [Candidatus Micrarchaeota archaeon]
MPRKKKAPEIRKVQEAVSISESKFSDGILYALIISLIVVLISGAYYKISECTENCVGQNIANGYPYPWFSYNTYYGWQSGSINWLGGILDIVFWAFIAFVVMLVLYAAIKEV